MILNILSIYENQDKEDKKELKNRPTADSFWPIAEPTHLYLNIIDGSCSHDLEPHQLDMNENNRLLFIG